MVLGFGGLGLAAMAPTHLPTPAAEASVLSRARPGNGVSVELVTTGSARVAERRVMQGGGFSRVEVAYRFAVIQHPRATLWFGSGASERGL